MTTDERESRYRDFFSKIHVAWDSHTNEFIVVCGQSFCKHKVIRVHPSAIVQMDLIEGAALNHYNYYHI